MTRITKLATAMLIATALTACSAGPALVKGAPAPPGSASASEVDGAFDLLMNGDESGARKRLKIVLKRDPLNANARLLSDSVGRDPSELLGPQNYSYAVLPGDTIVGLAQRFLGNRLKAYQLLRYNGLKAPTVLTAGQTLKIPGEPPRIEPVRRPDLGPTGPTPQAPALTPKFKPPAPKSVAPSTNPAAARQLRGAGLAALNQGNVDRAVGLLRRAATLDPRNPLIARDLVRAERIAATVKAKR